MAESRAAAKTHRMNSTYYRAQPVRTLHLCIFFLNFTPINNVKQYNHTFTIADN